MTTTVAHQVVERVEALMRDEGVATQAEAIRRVAAEMNRSVAATSSAFYAGRRAAGDDDEPPAPSSAARRSGAPQLRPRLFAEMLPLVEAGASIEQAARRFGDEDDADDIAAGFARWLLSERASGAEGSALVDARRRVTALEAEVRGLRRDLARATQVLARIRAIADDVLREPADR